MTYALLLLLYRVWLVVGVVLLLCCLSSAVFGRRKGRVMTALKAIPMALLWPLAVLSKEGRSALFRTFPNQW